MSNVAVCVENLSKRYVISHGPAGDDGLRHKVEDFVRAPLRRLRSGKGAAKVQQEEFWALRDVSFEIRQGEVLGVIGRNGAGKSTLLKILSRITEPTSGSVRINGRVASLLEVGTGFHPELSGRENVFLNGAILGMAQSEIQRRFDEIVAFSGVERFLDTPVKRYSSGMYVRLAFAVAAHLDPEILIVDEVLSVGDAEFQKKCLARLGQIAHSGKTVLMVSHNMEAVSGFCSRCLFLKEGRLEMDGPAIQVANAYLGSSMNPTASKVWTETTAVGDDLARLMAVRIVSEEGALLDTADVRQPIGIEMEYDLLQSGFVLMPLFDVVNESGNRLFLSVDVDPAWRQKPRPAGRYVSTAWIPGNFLTEGMVTMGVGIMSLNPDKLRMEVADVVGCRIVDSMDARNTARGDYPKSLPGVVRPMLEWTTRCSNGQ
jgi:lipopolysaccharide transport system ATP-binding protein